MNTIDRLIDKLFGHSWAFKMCKVPFIKWLFTSLIRYRLWRMERFCLFVFRHGTVRQIQEIGNHFAKVEHPDWKRTGEYIEAKAEDMILRRIGF